MTKTKVENGIWIQKQFYFKLIFAFHMGTRQFQLDISIKNIIFVLLSLNQLLHCLLLHEHNFKIMIHNNEELWSLIYHYIKYHTIPFSKTMTKLILIAVYF